MKFTLSHDDAQRGVAALDEVDARGRCHMGVVGVEVAGNQLSTYGVDAYLQTLGIGDVDAIVASLGLQQTGSGGGDGVASGAKSSVSGGRQNKATGEYRKNE